MKSIKILSIIILLLTVSSQAFSKNSIGTSDSVNLLRKLTEEGNVVRSADIPMEKVDVTDDTKRAKLLKYQFYELVKKEFTTIEIKDAIKNPLIYKGLFE